MDADKRRALLNVAVFSPLTFYGLAGKEPPKLLVYASAAYALYWFLSDLKVLTNGEPKPPDLEGLPRPDSAASDVAYRGSPQTRDRRRSAFRNPRPGEAAPASDSDTSGTDYARGGNVIPFGSGRIS